MIRQRQHERGSVLVVVLILASAIAGLAAISAAGILSASRLQSTLEDEAVALNDAYARLQHALNVVNSSAYDEANRNLELLDAINGKHGGTAGGEGGPTEPWLQDPEGIVHGKVAGTDVRVYQGRDYVKRLAKIRGRQADDVDPDGLSRSYYVLEAVGRARDTLRLVSALVRENEPFSAFVFFQNIHTLGVSGAPRGLIHSNDQVAFYFPNGSYVDSVSAVNGFLYEAGASGANTNVLSGNPEALPIELEKIDFAALRERTNLFVGDAGLDAEIELRKGGVVRITQYSPPRYENVEHSWTGDVLIGYEPGTVTEIRPVQIGTAPEMRTRQVQVGTTTETYTVNVPVYETQVVQRTRQVPVYEDQVVERSRNRPVYEMQIVTKTRRVQVFVPFDSQPGSGTAVGGGGGIPGEWIWVDESYEAEEQVLVGHVRETYTETVRVQTGTLTETYTENVQVQVGTAQETRTRNVPVYETETYMVDVPVYENQPVQVPTTVPVYETRSYTWTTRQLLPPAKVDNTDVTLDEYANTIYIDGRITSLEGDLQGRLTIIGNEKVRITGSLRYVDTEGDTAMLNGSRSSDPYVRNPEYGGNSVLGVIARENILFTRDLPNEAEINGTLLSATGRVGIDGFAIQENGDPTKNWQYGMTPEQIDRESAYESTRYRTRRFKKESLRRIGGLISNDRILETYIAPGKDGTAVVDSGFKRGVMRYDTNLIFNPPPNFVEVPRPVVTSVAPIYFMRNDE